MNNFDESIIKGKYHLIVAERMYQNYWEFQDKRFLVGIINESAKAVSNIIKAYLIRESMGGKNAQKNLNIFMKVIVPKYLDETVGENLFKILEVERAQKISPIQYAKNDKIILLIGDRYRFLTAKRIGEFLSSAKEAIKQFENFRQV